MKIETLSFPKNQDPFSDMVFIEKKNRGRSIKPNIGLNVTPHIGPNSNTTYRAFLSFNQPMLDLMGIESEADRYAQVYMGDNSIGIKLHDGDGPEAEGAFKLQSQANGVSRRIVFNCTENDSDIFRKGSKTLKIFKVGKKQFLIHP